MWHITPRLLHFCFSCPGGESFIFSDSFFLIFPSLTRFRICKPANIKLHPCWILDFKSGHNGPDLKCNTTFLHVYYLGWNRSPAQAGWVRQVLGPGALGRPRGIRWRGRWEGGSGWRIHVTPWLIHVNVWQKPLQYCKVISLQLIKINEKKCNTMFLKWENTFLIQNFWVTILRCRFVNRGWPITCCLKQGYIFRRFI